MKSTIALFSGMIIFMLLTTGCSISLSGVQVPPEVNTFNVEYIANNADIQIPTLSQEVTDLLTEKIQKETRLQFANEAADITFSGEITKYESTSQAPTAGQNTSLNRLLIAVKITYTDNQDEENSWTDNFSNFANFDPNENLANVQDDLIASILKDVIEDIYQKAFTNW